MQYPFAIQCHGPASYYITPHMLLRHGPANVFDSLEVVDNISALWQPAWKHARRALQSDPKMKERGLHRCDTEVRRLKTDGVFDYLLRCPPKTSNTILPSGYVHYSR